MHCTTAAPALDDLNCITTASVHNIMCCAATAPVHYNMYYIATASAHNMYCNVPALYTTASTAVTDPAQNNMYRTVNATVPVQQNVQYCNSS
jgi:hypothetical protein